MNRKRELDFVANLSREIQKPDSVDRLVNYLTSSHRTGRRFELYGSSANDPDRITPADLIAVTLLSVRIAENDSSLKPSSVILLDDQRIMVKITEELARIPNNLAIENADFGTYKEFIERADRISKILRTDAQINSRVARYKLLARKRPLLFPIRDSVVERELSANYVTNWYELWFNSFQDTRYDVRKSLENLRLAAEKRLQDNFGHRQLEEFREIGLLRIADIVIWERSFSR